MCRGAVYCLLADGAAELNHKGMRMSWRAGAEVFWEMWPKVKAALPDPDNRTDFTRRLLALFLDNDVDPCQMYGGDSEIDELMEELNPEI
jgi:hypothetical protein